MTTTMIFMTIALVFITLISAVAITALVLRRKGPATVDRVEVRQMAEQVRSVGKLVGLEVHAKEIATAKSGWSWAPPILLSQARLAMIFQFEKQYFADLSLMTGADVEETEPGHFTLNMPPVEGALRLTDVEPYDIQQGRVLGLLEVIPMNAERQSALMAEAQRQAADLFDKKNAKFQKQAQHAIERELRSLFEMFDIKVKFVWPDKAAESDTEANMTIAAEALS